MTDVETQQTAQILTRGVFDDLIKDLDASDVLECYGLVRNAPLHQPRLNTTITVQKMAIGLRYQPPMNSRKDPLELTLEYGPLRMLLKEEAMPVLQQNDNYLTWDNQARIYYTTESIHSLSWKSAYYMASMTGAVLETVLESAVAYAEAKTRYQPFSVWQNDKQILRSSSSIDFVFGVWSSMAKLGVEIRPILSPPIYLPRLIVQGMEKVSGFVNGRLVTEEASAFYEKLEDCWTAIATQDYSRYSPPTEAPTQVPSVAPSLSNVPSHGEATELPSSVPSTTGADLADLAVNTPDDSGTSQSPSNATEMLQDEVADGVSTDDNVTLPGLNVTNNDGSLRRLGDEVPEPFADLEDVDDDDYTDLNGTYFPTASPNEPNQVQIHADEAHDFAAQTQNASCHDAAEAAANAAQKTADAAQALAAMENLLSGDGDLVSSAVRECFSRPQFGIRGENGTIGYLYLDGNFYYQLNLTAPYVDVVKFDRPLPRSKTQDPVKAGGDVVDMTLAFVLIALLVFGFFALLQQIGCRMGFHYSQKRFFSPRHDHDDISDALEEESVSSDADRMDDCLGIPFSMGGRKSPPYRRRTIVPIVQNEHPKSRSSSDGDMELVPTRSATVPPRFARHPDLVDMPNLKSSSKVAVPVAHHSANGDNGSKLLVV